MTYQTMPSVVYCPSDEDVQAAIGIGRHWNEYVCFRQQFELTQSYDALKEIADNCPHMKLANFETDQWSNFLYLGDVIEVTGTFWEVERFIVINLPGLTEAEKTANDPQEPNLWSVNQS